MLNVDVTCPDNECGHAFEYECEHEEAGAGSNHQAKCDACGQLINFEIDYLPVAGNETIASTLDR